MSRSDDRQAEVTYRATTHCGCDVELTLCTEPAAATVGDAWALLSAAYRDLDPRSLEIEIRQIAAAGRPGGARADQLVSAQCALPTASR